MRYEIIYWHDTDGSVYQMDLVMEQESAADSALRDRLADEGPGCAELRRKLLVEAEQDSRTIITHHHDGHREATP